MASLVRKLVGGTAIAVTSTGLMLSSMALAAGPGGGGGGQGGGGSGGEETEQAKNLSVPTIFVPDTGSFTLSCGAGTPGDLLHAAGDPLTGYPIDPDAYYYLQGTNTWQAQCETLPAGSVDATAAWGDNLTGSANKSTGHPIRVEVALSDDVATPMAGFAVEKLDPKALDRDAPYGILATSSGDGYVDNPLAPFSSTGVFDTGATLKIYNVATPQSPIVDGPAAAEINSMGAVVYGYNLRAPAAGTYVIEFGAPDVTITGANAGAVSAGHVVTLQIAVTSGSGGGGGSEETTTTTVATTTTVTTTTPPPTTTAPQASSTVTAAPPATSQSVTSGSPSQAIPSPTAGGGASRGEAAILATKSRALSQLNAAIATTNRSIHKFHTASVQARKAGLALHAQLAANVKRLEGRLHSLLARRRLLVASLPSGRS